MRTRVSGSVTGSIPVSTATVAIAMTPWPHMVLNPSLCMKRMPKSASGETGGVTRQPYMSACPRGSHIRAFLKGSQFCMASRRRSRMVSPSSSGKPPVTTRKGSPPVWLSMVVIRSHSSGGCQAVMSHLLRIQMASLEDPSARKSPTRQGFSGARTLSACHPLSSCRAAPQTLPWQAPIPTRV